MLHSIKSVPRTLRCTYSSITGNCTCSLTAVSNNCIWLLSVSSSSWCCADHVDSTDPNSLTLHLFRRNQLYDHNFKSLCIHAYYYSKLTTVTEFIICLINNTILITTNYRIIFHQLIRSSILNTFMRLIIGVLTYSSSFVKVSH